MLTSSDMINDAFPFQVFSELLLPFLLQTSVIAISREYVQTNETKHKYFRVLTGRVSMASEILEKNSIKHGLPPRLAKRKEDNLHKQILLNLY